MAAYLAISRYYVVLSFLKPHLRDLRTFWGWLRVKKLVPTPLMVHDHDIWFDQ